MPRKCLMSWEGAPKYRWVKMYKGERYRVSCEQLGAMVFTQEATVKLANEWWEQQQRELERDPAQEILNRYRAEDLREQIAKGQAAQEMLASLNLNSPDSGIMPHVVEVLKEKYHQPERLAALDSELDRVATEPDRTLQKQAERFLAVELTRKKSPTTYGDLAETIRRWQRTCPILPSNLDVSSITEATITDFYTWLVNDSPNKSGNSQSKYWGYFQRLIQFLAEQRLCPMPMNLYSRLFTFDTSAKPVQIPEVELVRKMLAKLPKRLKLYALLALNCGMYAVDMGDLKQGELKNGRIIRKRTKTRAKQNVPTVEYPLWLETQALLDSYPRLHPEYVLTTSTGTPLWRVEVRAGKTSKTDNVSMQWRRGRGEGRQHKPEVSLKALRKLSANLIEQNERFADRCSTLFLGHAPTSIKDKHYVKPTQAIFDEAILWLRSEILGGEPLI